MDFFSSIFNNLEDQRLAKDFYFLSTDYTISFLHIFFLNRLSFTLVKHTRIAFFQFERHFLDSHFHIENGKRAYEVCEE
jgi:hypothetical protein